VFLGAANNVWLLARLLFTSKARPPPLSNAHAASWVGRWMSRAGQLVGQLAVVIRAMTFAPAKQLGTHDCRLRTDIWFPAKRNAANPPSARYDKARAERKVSIFHFQFSREVNFPPFSLKSPGAFLLCLSRTSNVSSTPLKQFISSFRCSLRSRDFMCRTFQGFGFCGDYRARGGGAKVEPEASVVSRGACCHGGARSSLRKRAVLAPPRLSAPRLIAIAWLLRLATQRGE
jgi:hypothetical protein